VNKGICIAGPYIGAPYAAMLLESLAARGVTQVIVVGWCGAVRDDVQVGDLIIPQKAIVDEGTSRHYMQLEGPVPVSCPDPALGTRLLCMIDPLEATVLQAPIWTTDAIYRETEKKVAWFRDKGAAAVEMECSALFSVARFRRIAVTAILSVSDSVAARQWDPGFRNKRFKKARKTACRAAMQLAGMLCDNE
jgi:uridine phosphorylase